MIACLIDLNVENRFTCQSKTRVPPTANNGFVILIPNAVGLEWRIDSKSDYTRPVDTPNEKQLKLQAQAKTHAQTYTNDASVFTKTRFTFTIPQKNKKQNQNLSCTHKSRMWVREKLRRGKQR